MENKRLLVLFWLGAALILVITFAKLLWVMYFPSLRAGEDKTFLELAQETMPLFIVVVVVGLAVGWLRNRNK